MENIKNTYFIYPTNFKVVGISFRRREQFQPDVVWDVLGSVVQSNARLGWSDRLELHLDRVMMAAVNGRTAVKTKEHL